MRLYKKYGIQWPAQHRSNKYRTHFKDSTPQENENIQVKLNFRPLKSVIVEPIFFQFALPDYPPDQGPPFQWIMSLALLAWLGVNL